ncbi:MAG TPA: hypothetical protein VM734_04260, partial [Kofleriaceae bacterium]|nr:hypothetical protein [Kofleriaceae bacterium]
KGDRWIPASAGAGLAALVPGARRVELDGDDHLPFVGDREALVGEVETFLRDMPTVLEGPVRLATVLAARTNPDGLARLRQAIASMRGVVLDDDGAVVVAQFDVPGAALRAFRHGGATTAAVDAAVVPAHDAGALRGLAAAIRATALAAPDGALRLTPTARALAGEPGDDAGGDGRGLR